VGLKMFLSSVKVDIARNLIGEGTSRDAVRVSNQVSIFVMEDL
jgi:hypothetical protein